MSAVGNSWTVAPLETTTL